MIMATSLLILLILAVALAILILEHQRLAQMRGEFVVRHRDLRARAKNLSIREAIRDKRMAELDERALMLEEARQLAITLYTEKVLLVQVEDEPLCEMGWLEFVEMQPVFSIESKDQAQRIVNGINGAGLCTEG